MTNSSPDRKPAENQEVECADLFVRFSAWIVDLLLLIVMFVPVLIFLLFYWYATYGNPVGGGHSSEELTVMWLVPIGTLVVYGFHRVYRLVVSGQSRGMRLSGIEIVRLDDGKRISFPGALVRTALSPAVAALGFTAATLAGFEYPLWGVLLWLVFPIPALWNPANRGWHDQIAGAVVVTKRTASQH
ncbi:RDD family protein [Candidatus Poriferisodalis sp.]|uniref:RDD family protein n=1 Tax=Candidatus Poriferisodalis sp. TaxID=3101277 RepID=UPI003B02AC3F